MKASHQKTSASLTSRLGNWLPDNPDKLNDWLGDFITKAETKDDPLHPVVAEFKHMIESDPALSMYFTQMFQQQPTTPPPPGSGDIKIKDCHQMLVVINHVLTTAPAYNKTGMVGLPINAILEYPMMTPAGLAAFIMPKVNAMFKKILNAWTQFLDSPDSRYVLNDSSTGWLSADAQKVLHLEEFQTKPAEPYMGFKSWNDFFTREFKPGMRPVAGPDDDRVIVSVCESSPYAIKTNVKEFDTFWIKSQPYSLCHMLNGHFVDQFVGGTVYQAYLNAGNYHRWHSPVSGTVRKVELVPGTYYAEAASIGFDPAGPNESQGYLAHVATRALIFIEADNPVIGLMCVVAIGMAEVSSCVPELANGEPLKEGQRLKKGEQIGYFQFGGSTYCLVFRPGVISDFALQAIPQGGSGSESATVKLNSFLARSR